MKTNYFLKSVITCTLFTASLCSFQMKADAIVIGGIAYNLNDSLLTAETAALPEGKYTGNLVIPANVSNDGKTYSVVKIGNGSLRDAPELTSVTLPEGLKVIGNSSFASDTSITSIVLPSTVTSVEPWAFFECKGLASINIPDSVKSIEAHAFQKTGLTSIVLPASVTSLETCAFQNASKLASINIENVTEIGAWALFETAITSVTIGNVFNIGSESFKNCEKLKDLTFSGNVITISDWAFQNIGASSVVLPASLISLGTGAFADCDTLKSVTIPKGVKSLKEWTFSSSDMEEMYISWDTPALVSSIIVSENAFANVNGTPEWKVSSELMPLYTNPWNGFPVSIAGSTTDINTVTSENVNAYYNDGVLNLINMPGYTVSIYSVGGQKITQFQVNTENAQVPVSLTTGIYLVNSINANNRKTIKFIVK